MVRFILWRNKSKNYQIGNRFSGISIDHSQNDLFSFDLQQAGIAKEDSKTGTEENLEYFSFGLKIKLQCYLKSSLLHFPESELSPKHALNLDM